MKKVVLILSAVIMIAVIALCVYFQDQSSINAVQFIVNTEAGITQNIQLFHNEGKYYAFLPSYADFETMRVKYSADHPLYLDGEKYDTQSSFSNIVTDREYALEIKNPLGITVCEETLLFVKSGSIPTVSITLMNGTVEDLHQNKNVKKTGTLAVIGATGEIDYIGSFGSIGGRGNTTWSEKKKPYNLEFDTDTQLLGMGATKKYSLLANACDESNLRNKLAYDLAKEMGVSHCIDSEFVDLYIDDVYYGLYLLCESVEIGQNVIDITDLEQLTQQVNQYPLRKSETFEITSNGMFQKGLQISNNPADITGGYLLEIEFPDRLVHDDSGFTTKDNTCFYIKAPQYASFEQVGYISDLFQRVEDLLEHEEVNQYIDLESWARYYLVHEVVANSDIGSFYFCKDSDTTNRQIVAGPVWDCDFSLGSGYLGLDLSPRAFYVNTWGWFEKLYRNPAFVELVKTIYANEMKTVMDRVLNIQLDRYVNQIQASYRMNELRWKGIQSFQWCNHYDTLQEHRSYLSNFLTQRISFLDSAWIDGIDYYRVYYKSEGPLYLRHHDSVEYGEVYGEFPVLSYEGYEFLGYFDKTTGAPYDPSKPVTENQFFIAKWKRSNAATDGGWKRVIRNILVEVYYNFEVYFCMALFLCIVLVVSACIFVDYRRRRRSGNA